MNDDINFNKILVSNMYKNILVIYSYHSDFFDYLGIREDMNIDNSDDFNILYNFMKKIVLYNSNNSNFKYIFTLLVDGLSEYVDYSKADFRSKEKEYLEFFTKGWYDLIDSYKKLEFIT